MALDRLDLTVMSGQIHALIGPNGAGKTTALNLISGIYKPSAGSVKFGGRTISGMKVHRVAQLGLRRTFQNLRLFHSLTVLENVLVGVQCADRSNLLHALFGLPAADREQHRLNGAAAEALAFVDLWDKRGWSAASLSYGQQRMLEIARILASRPEMLLLDEPAAGLNDVETGALVNKLAKIREAGTSVLLIEHNMSLVMEVADQITVLDFGCKIAEGTAAEVSDNPAVIEAYLGREDDHVTSA